MLYSFAQAFFYFAVLYRVGSVFQMTIFMKVLKIVGDFQKIKFQNNLVIMTDSYALLHFHKSLKAKFFQLKIILIRSSVFNEEFIYAYL